MKKMVCLLVAFIMIFGLCNCTKKAKKEPTEKPYAIIGETVTFEDDGYLDDYDTISIDIPDDISVDEYDLLMGVYMGEDYTYYYLPNPDALQNGRVEYETLHHSTHGAAKVEKATLIAEWSKRAAVNIVTKNTADGNVEETFGELVNGVLEEYGLNSGTYGGTVLEYVLSQDTKGEILQAAIDGDQIKLKQKTASLIADALCEKAKIDGAGDLVDVVCAYTNGENWAEGAAEMSKEIQKKVFPEIDAVSKFADLVDKSFDVWAANTMDETYRYQYAKRSVNKDGSISDNDWDEIYSNIRGAWARYNSKGISEADLRQSFETRAKNERKISEKEAELKKLAKQWDEDGLLNSHYYSENLTAADRLKSLYQSRETIIKMFTKNGKLQKGAYSGKSDADFIDVVHFKWVTCGVKGRNEFYKWLEEEGIVPKTEYKDNYAWVLVHTEVIQEEDSRSEYYADTYKASENTHTKISESVGGDYKGTKGSFVATCDTPPAVIYADKEFSMHLTVTASGKTAELGFIANAWVNRDGMVHLETKDGQGTFTVGTGDRATDRSFDVTLYCTRGPGSEGSKFELDFYGCDSNTIWTYEWKNLLKNK